MLRLGGQDWKEPCHMGKDKTIRRFHRTREREKLSRKEGGSTYVTFEFFKTQDVELRDSLAVKTPKAQERDELTERKE